MPNIWGQNLASVACWILPPEPADSRNRSRVLVHSPQRTHPSGIFRKGCSILCHVVCLFVKWEAREYPSWHFGFDGPFTFLSDMPHVKKYCFLPVSSHWREQFHLVFFLPYGAKHRHIQCSFFLVFSGNWSERMCNNCVSDTYPGYRAAQLTVLKREVCLLEMLGKWLFWEKKLHHSVLFMRFAMERKCCFYNNKYKLKCTVIISRFHHLNFSMSCVHLCSWLIYDIPRKQIPD